MHEYGLIVTLAASFSIALVLGFATQRLGASPILGYLLAGIAAGPHTPGFVADAALAAQLAEVGVILLMFGVGLHFHPGDLLAVKGIAVPGAVAQSAVATALGALVAVAFGWSFGAGAVLGMAVAVASTVVLMRVLLDNDQLGTAHGRIAVGWLIVEDIFTVVVLVLLPVMAGALSGTAAGLGAAAGALGWALFKLAVLFALLLGVGSRVVPKLLAQVARSRSRELFTLAVLAAALAIAAGSALLFGASMALGAFLAGMVVGRSETSHQAAADALPMRDAFAVLFFVSVGMLFDPRFVFREPALVLSVLAIILVAKPLAALAIVLGLGYSVRTALTVAVGLAQIGEFSFILAEAGRRLGVLPEEATSVLVACALISIALNPLAFRTMGPIEAWLRARPRLWAILERRAARRGRAANEATARALAAERNAIHAIVVGYGPVGETASALVRDFGIEPVIVELNVDTVTRLVREGKRAIYGDASRRDILESAGIRSARVLLVTLPDLASRAPVITTARALNPKIKILVRARYLAERRELERLGADAVCYEEAEAAVGLAELLLEEVGADQARIRAEAEKIRRRFAIRRGPLGAGETA